MKIKLVEPPFTGPELDTITDILKAHLSGTDRSVRDTPSKVADLVHVHLGTTRYAMIDDDQRATVTARVQAYAQGLLDPMDSGTGPKVTNHIKDEEHGLPILSTAQLQQLQAAAFIAGPMVRALPPDANDEALAAEMKRAAIAARALFRMVAAS